MLVITFMKLVQNTYRAKTQCTNTRKTLQNLIQIVNKSHFEKNPKVSMQGAHSK